MSDTGGPRGWSTKTYDMLDKLVRHYRGHGVLMRVVWTDGMWRFVREADLPSW